jgi:hypothetical protein
MEHKPAWAIIVRPRPTFSKSQKLAILNHTHELVKAHAEKQSKMPGVCWHCDQELSLKTVQIDHHPQPFRFIATLWCDPMNSVPSMCRCRDGMTADPSYLGNLVPSCKSCNLSHRFERSYDNCSFRWCSLAFRLRLIVCGLMLVMFVFGVGLMVVVKR